MSNLIVIEFTTVDGVVEDPDGSGGTRGGGWALRHGPEAIAGDPFRIGPLLGTGVTLLGRATWEMFAKIWPNRTDELATMWNTVPKLVASRSLTSVDGWQNSSLIDDDLVTTVRRCKAKQDVIVAGSVSVVRTLADHDLVDEYRIMMFPTVVGTGQRLFPERSTSTDLQLSSVEQRGPTAVLRYRRSDRPAEPTV